MICPRCGAENQPSAKICRMCATPLDAAGAAAGVAPPKQSQYAGGGMGMSVGTRDAKPASSPVGAPGPGEILCPTCKAVNDSTWAYCQQCGSQLHKPGMQKQPVSAPPPTPPPPQPVPMPAMPAAPAVQSKPMPMQPVQSPPPSRPPAMPQMAVPPSPPAVPAPAPVRDGSIVTCPSCGRINTPGSSFCATCGTALPADQVMPVAVGRGNIPKLRLIQEGGGDGEIYKLESDETVVGRNSGDIRFPHDGYMSGRHARIIRRGDHFILVDENSRNGTFKRIDGEVELKAGDIILIGKQLFRFEL